MQIISADWEVRNLGVTCCEVTFMKDDDINHILELGTLKYEYQVVKIPIEKSDFLLKIQDFGFKFIEILFTSSHDLKLPRLNGIVDRLKNSVIISEADESQIENIRNKILCEIFQSDRVALDPYFGVKKSATRYLGWLSDEIISGSKVYEMYFQDQPIGFFVLKYQDNICYARLGGIYSNSNLAGFGVLLNYFELVIAKNFGCHLLKGSFSSNNPSIFKINHFLGYKTEPTYNVFVKHSLN